MSIPPAQTQSPPHAELQRSLLKPFWRRFCIKVMSLGSVVELINEIVVSVKIDQLSTKMQQPFANWYFGEHH